MKDYSECIINAREFLARTEDCFNSNNPMGAYHHAMALFREAEELLDIALEEIRE
jgi:hypothetical protein